MAKKFRGGIPQAVGFDMKVNRPLDESAIVETFDSLLIVASCLLIKRKKIC